MGRRKRERELREWVVRLEERQHGERIARKLQRREYARRLADLNHEASRIKEAAAASVSRELFDATIAEWRRWQGTINVRMATWAGASAMLGFILSWFIRRGP